MTGDATSLPTTMTSHCPLLQLVMAALAFLTASMLRIVGIVVQPCVVSAVLLDEFSGSLEYCRLMLSFGLMTCC